MGRRSDQVSFEAKTLRVCVECNVCRLSSRNLDRVVCGAPSEDVENMPADQGETMIGALSKCKGKGKHGAQRASVRARAGNQQFNFSGIYPHDVEGFGKLAVNLEYVSAYSSRKVSDIFSIAALTISKKMPQKSRSQFCCEISSNPDMKENVGADKVKFLLDLCSEEDEEEEQHGERRKRVRRLACSLHHACKSIFTARRIGMSQEC